MLILQAKGFKEMHPSLTGKSVELVIPIGCLLDKEFFNGAIAYGTDQIEAPPAFGFCQTGERITLIDLSKPEVGIFNSRNQIRNLRATSGTVCNTAFVQPNPVIRSSTLKISGLWRWVGKHFGEVESRYQARKWIDTSAIWSSENSRRSAAIQ